MPESAPCVSSCPALRAHLALFSCSCSFNPKHPQSIGQDDHMQAIAYCVISATGLQVTPHTLASPPARASYGVAAPECTLITGGGHRPATPITRPTLSQHPAEYSRRIVGSAALSRAYVWQCERWTMRKPIFSRASPSYTSTRRMQDWLAWILRQRLFSITFVELCLEVPLDLSSRI